MHRTLSCLLAALAIAGCHDGRVPRADQAQAPTRPRRDFLQSIPAPLSRLNDTTGTPEAQHLEYGSIFSVDSIHGWYRNQLRRLGWEVQSDGVQDSGVTMYATKDSSALWLRVWRDGPISRFSLIGSTITPGRGGAAAPAAARH